MSTNLPRRVSWIVLIVATAVAAVVVLNWQGVLLGTAALLAERRPALLRDAKWGDANSAHQFQQRFQPGVPERELTAWLKTNGFKVVAPGHASKLISSFPCNEIVSVDWIGGSPGQLQKTTARVAEAGCL